MAVIGLEEIVASHAELFEFGQERIRQVITAGSNVSIPIVVGSNKIRFIYEFKFGNITANVINFRWDNVRNAVERNLLLGTEQLNFTNRPFPYLIIKEGRGYVVVQNIGGQDVTFEMTIDYFETIKQFVEDIGKYLKWKDII